MHIPWVNFKLCIVGHLQNSVQSREPLCCFAISIICCKNLCEYMMHIGHCPSEEAVSNFNFWTICCPEEKLESPCPTFATWTTLKPSKTSKTSREECLWCWWWPSDDFEAGSQIFQRNTKNNSLVGRRCGCRLGKHKLKLLSQLNVWRPLTREGC